MSAKWPPAASGNAKGVAPAGDDPDYPRPDFISVEWLCSVQPNNMIDEDTWYDTSEDS